jgi:hypothetical protein
MRMREIALELVARMANRVGHKVGWNPIPVANQVPIQQAWASLVRAISARFTFEPSDEFRVQTSFEMSRRGFLLILLWSSCAKAMSYVYILIAQEKNRKLPDINAS